MSKEEVFGVVRCWRYTVLHSTSQMSSPMLVVRIICASDHSLRSAVNHIFFLWIPAPNSGIVVQKRKLRHPIGIKSRSCFSTSLSTAAVFSLKGGNAHLHVYIYIYLDLEPLGGWLKFESFDRKQLRAGGVQHFCLMVCFFLAFFGLFLWAVGQREIVNFECGRTRLEQRGDVDAYAIH
eukprot:gene4106-2952_t